MKLIEADANTFLAEGDHKKVDILFADFYHGQGLDRSQLEARFITQCQARLKANGWLVLNCWGTGQTWVTDQNRSVGVESISGMRCLWESNKVTS